MNAITVKLSEETLRRLRREAKQSGRSVAALIRERLEAPAPTGRPTLFDLGGDLLGAVDGPARSATNDRPKFKRR